MERPEVNNLRLHIEELAKELRSYNTACLNATAQQYKEIMVNRAATANMLAIAKNELQSLLHEYEFSLLGEKNGRSGTPVVRRIRGKIFSEIDLCISKIRRPDPKKEELVPVIGQIHSEYADLYNNKKFEIRYIRQVK